MRSRFSTLNKFQKLLSCISDFSRNVSLLSQQMKEAQELIGKQSLKELSQENIIKGDISMQQRTNYHF